MSIEASEEESEFSVKRFKDEEIVLDSTYTSHYDSLFGAGSDDDDYSDADRGESLKEKIVSPDESFDKVASSKQQIAAKPVVNAASASRFGAKKASIPAASSFELPTAGEKRIINLQKPQEKHQPEPQPIQNFAQIASKIKAKVNPFAQMHSPKVSLSLPVANTFTEPLHRQSNNFSFSKLENWLKVIAKPQNINPLEFITLAHANFAAGFSSLEALMQNMQYICSISA